MDKARCLIHISDIYEPPPESIPARLKKGTVLERVINVDGENHRCRFHPAFCRTSVRLRGRRTTSRRDVGTVAKSRNSGFYAAGRGGGLAARLRGAAGRKVNLDRFILSSDQAASSRSIRRAEVGLHRMSSRSAKKSVRLTGDGRNRGKPRSRLRKSRQDEKIGPFDRWRQAPRLSTIPPTATYSEAPVLQEKKKSRAGVFFLGAFSGCLVVFVGLMFFALTMAAGRQGGSTDFKFSTNKIAIVPIEGEILESRDIIEALHRHADNSMVKAMVVRITPVARSLLAGDSRRSEIRQRRQASRFDTARSLGRVLQRRRVQRDRGHSGSITDLSGSCSGGSRGPVRGEDEAQRYQRPIKAADRPTGVSEADSVFQDLAQLHDSFRAVQTGQGKDHG